MHRLASDLLPFKNTHPNKRCFVMGNGPSLNQTDLSRLKGEQVFACNGAFLLFDRIDWRPQFYTCVDARVIQDRASEIVAMLQANPEMVAFFPREIRLHDGSGRVIDTHEIIPPARNRYYFNETGNAFSALPHSAFSLDANERLAQPYTVAITMLQLAAYMGFNPIYLIGCDTSYTVPESTKQEGRKVGEHGLLLTSTQDDDPNHFHPGYFGKGHAWHNPQVDKMIEHHGYAKQVLDEAGITVMNATVGGQLEVYPRIDFNDVTDPYTSFLPAKVWTVGGAEDRGGSVYLLPEGAGNYLAIPFIGNVEPGRPIRAILEVDLLTDAMLDVAVNRHGSSSFEGKSFKRQLKGQKQTIEFETVFNSPHPAARLQISSVHHNAMVQVKNVALRYAD